LGRRAVFLDRDGTINVEKGFVHRIKDFEFVDDAVRLIGRLNDAGFLVIVVTNQSGIARGLYTEDDVERLHRFVNGELQKGGARIDRFYYCPHHPEAPDPAYRKECVCRKPNPGMVHRAIGELDIDASGSFLVGDRLRDVCAGKRSGLFSILIREDEDVQDSTTCNEEPDLVVKTLAEAVSYILQH
jgi:D-glycero-D-manno-heptose 1,7-bisphosphate phosphatase